MVSRILSYDINKNLMPATMSRLITWSDPKRYLDYHSANLELESSDIQQAAEQGSIYNVFGDVTKPVR